MRYVIAFIIFISILSITLNTCLNAINQKNKLIHKQEVEIKTYQKNIIGNQQTIKSQKDKYSSLQSQLNIAKDANKHLKYLGKFLITYYDLQYESCGKNKGDKGYGITYSGNPAEINVSCAVDKSVISLGSYIYINGIGCRVAEDIGGAIKGNHIDVFVSDFSYDKYKNHYTDVYLIN